MMNFPRSTQFFLFTAVLISSCASAGKAPSRKMRAPNEDFSYRVRGTESTGTMSKDAQKKLFQLTKHWAWPLKKLAVSSHFGNRHGDFHDGLDLKANGGTPVFSVADGKVIYSADRISGYGRMVVVKHANDLSTVYAHNNKLLVKKGTFVKRGELIAMSGNTGRSSGPHLHFEVREGVKAVNPLYVLPRRGYEAIQTKTLASSGSNEKTRPTLVKEGRRLVDRRLVERNAADKRTVASSVRTSSVHTQSRRLLTSRRPASVVAAEVSTPKSARVVSSRLSQSAAVRPRWNRRYQVDRKTVPEKDQKRRRLIRVTRAGENTES